MPKFSQPIQITFYNPEDGEPEETFHCHFVPWGLFKPVVQLAKGLGGANLEKLTAGDLSEMDDNLADQMSVTVAALFGDRFTVEEMEEKCDLMEIAAVIGQVMTLAGDLANPTPAVPANQAKAAIQRSRKRH